MTEQRKEVVKLVNRYAAMTKQGQREVWASIYNLLGRGYGITLRTYQKRKSETLLDVAERNGVMPLLHKIISQMNANVCAITYNKNQF